MWDKVVEHDAGNVIIGPYIRCGNCVLCHAKSTWFAFVLCITSLYQVDRERSARDKFAVFYIVIEDILKEE